MVAYKLVEVEVVVACMSVVKAAYRLEAAEVAAEKLVFPQMV